jgi:prepilin-type N-terminal cleavage/methylation domain-containing protein
MRRSKGFTLIEMALVLLILALLGSALIQGLGAQLKRRDEAATDASLDEARDALLGYAIIHARLPCPARSVLDGAEDRDAAGCVAGRGNGLLPWATLGISGVDGWGHRLRYAVSPAFVSSIDASSIGDIQIRSRSRDGAEITLTTTTHPAPALILSHGANGLGSVDIDGNALAPPPAGTDEAQNAAAGRIFFARVAAENPAAPGGPFDDRVLWLSPYLLINHLLSAGRYP